MFYTRFCLSLLLSLFSISYVAIDDVELNPPSGNVAIEPCVDGFAGIYPCSNLDLMSHLTVGQMGGTGDANDIWGWVDPLNGDEYALVGLTNGTAFVDVTDPVNPVYLGILPTHTFSSAWRDVKVYSDHAFIVSEANGHGMQVFDLTKLRTVASPPETFIHDAHYSGFGDAHNIVINEQSGYAYGVGTGTFSGGLHFINIQNPTGPIAAGGFAADGYTHDAQVVNYIGPDPQHQGAEIAFASNADTFTIIDVTDKTDPEQVARETYPGEGYTHQGWVTEDHRYYLMNDELDEINFGHNTRTRIWDIQDLDNPFIIGSYDGPTTAIDHNLYIKGDLAFESNYRAGLRVLDISDVANGNLTEVGYFDVYPANDNANFNGSWSNYPYFPSGNIIISSIEGGLFVVRQSTPDGTDCTAFENAPTDLTKSFAPVSGVQDRVQLKWYKAVPQVKYTDEDAAACDIKAWKVRELDPVTGGGIGPVISNPDTISLVNRKKVYPDGSPRKIFKWPLFFRSDATDNSRRIDPNFRYKFKVRCACEHGAGQESPWSETKIFNTPDFDPVTGVYFPPSGFTWEDDVVKIKNPDDEVGIDIYPNPSNGSNMTLRLVKVTEISEKGLIRITDMKGSVLWSQERTLKETNSIIELEFKSRLPRGIYTLDVRMLSGIVRERFIVE